MSAFKQFLALRQSEKASGDEDAGDAKPCVEPSVHSTISTIPETQPEQSKCI